MAFSNIGETFSKTREDLKKHLRRGETGTGEGEKKVLPLNMWIVNRVRLIHIHGKLTSNKIVL